MTQASQRFSTTFVPESVPHVLHESHRLKVDFKLPLALNLGEAFRCVAELVEPHPKLVEQR